MLLSVGDKFFTQFSLQIAYIRDSCCDIVEIWWLRNKVPTSDLAGHEIEFRLEMLVQSVQVGDTRTLSVKFIVIIYFLWSSCSNLFSKVSFFSSLELLLQPRWLNPRNLLISESFQYPILFFPRNTILATISIPGSFLYVLAYMDYLVYKDCLLYTSDAADE